MEVLGYSLIEYRVKELKGVYTIEANIEVLKRVERIFGHKEIKQRSWVPVDSTGEPYNLNHGSGEGFALGLAETMPKVLLIRTSQRRRASLYGLSSVGEAYTRTILL